MLEDRRLPARRDNTKPAYRFGTVPGILANIEFDTNGGCWLWTAAWSASAGYGSIIIDGRHTTAHRAAWRLFRGEIPPGMKVCHVCDVRLCVNPDHLWLGTDSENAWDKVRKGRANCRSKIPIEAIDRILSDNRPYAVIGAEFGVSENAICGGGSWPRPKPP